MSLIHEHHPVGHLARKAKLVGHHNHRHPALRQLTHRIQHLLHPLWIQRTGGLIKKHHLWIQRQGPRNCNALLLATTELGRIFARLLADSHLIEQLNRALLRRGFGTLLHLDWRQGDVVENREVREQVELLKHHPNSLTNRPHLAFLMGGIQPHTEHIQFAAIQRFQSVEGANQRALARARRPHHHQHLATGHVQRHPIKSPQPWGIALHQISGTNSDRHRAERTGSSWISR